MKWDSLATWTIHGRCRQKWPCEMGHIVREHASSGGAADEILGDRQQDALAETPGARGACSKLRLMEALLTDLLSVGTVMMRHGSGICMRRLPQDDVAGKGDGDAAALAARRPSRSWCGLG